AFEFRFQIAYAQAAERNIRRPIERRIAHGQITLIRAVERVKRGGTIFHAATDGSDFIHRPTQTHRSITTDAAIGWSQAGYAAGGRWRDIDPSVSVPIENPTRPADVADAGPADE